MAEHETTLRATTGPSGTPGAGGGAEPGTRPAAFFDMDGTLLRCNSGTRWIHYLRRDGQLPLWKMARALSWMARYSLSLIDLDEVAAIAARDLVGRTEQSLIDETLAWFEAEIVPEIAEKGRAAVEHHRAAGHALALLSSSTPYVTEPLARELDIPHIICTRAVVRDGRFTGEHVRPACFGAGKIHWAKRFAEREGVDLAKSWFYTDSYSDLPMLLYVGEPRVVNPDLRLRRKARTAGWNIEEW